MTKSGFMLSVLTSVLLLATVARGGEYYVATDGDDGNPGTKDKPWRTIQKAGRSVVNGNTIIIRKGVYAETVKMDYHCGNAGVPIILKAADGEEVVIDASAGRDKPKTAALSIANGLRYIILDGLTIRNGWGDGILLTNVHHIMIQNCRVERVFAAADGPSAPACIRVANCHTVLIKNARLSDALAWVEGKGAGDVHKNSAGIVLTECEDVTLETNEIARTARKVVVTPAAPHDEGDVAIDPVVTFSWSAVLDAQDYEIEVGTEAGKSDRFAGRTGNVTSKAIAGGEVGRSLYARVRAITQDGPTFWSPWSNGIRISAGRIPLGKHLWLSSRSMDLAGKQSLEVIYRVEANRNETSQVILKVYTPAFSLVRFLYMDKGQGSYSLVWDLTDNYGKLIAPGTYFMTLECPAAGIRDVGGWRFSETEKIVVK